MATKRCSQCGAQVELPEGVFSTACAFCDAPLIDEEAVGEPVDRVVSFEVPRDRAGRLLASFLAGHWLAPEQLRKATRPEELRQVFVPFYAYDAVVRTGFKCKVGIYWYRTETYTTTVNGKTVVRTRQVRETEWHGFGGTHAQRWFDHLVSASRGLAESESNELEPFDLGRSHPYVAALTAGVEAELPTVEHEEAQSVAATELATLEKRVIAAEHLPGDTYSKLTSTSEVHVERMRLVLLPVWTAVYQGPKGVVRVLVNGQTGEVVGEVPRSWWKIGCLVSFLLSIVGAIVFAALGFAGLAALISELT